jgi:hypothetical protein
VQEYSEKDLLLAFFFLIGNFIDVEKSIKKKTLLKFVIILK